MKKLITLVISLHFFVLLPSCGKSEIDKCVDAKLDYYEQKHNNDTCWNKCKVLVSENSDQAQLPDREQEKVTNCLDSCETSLRDKRDLKQNLRVIYEADIRLECLRAASGRS